MASKLRVVLVNPPHTLEERYGSMKAAGNTMPALGLLQIASVLREAGLDPAVVDAPCRGLGYDATVREALSRDPQAVGMSAFTPSVSNAARTARLLRAARPGLPLVLGGPHAAALPERTLRDFAEFDACVTGEGEPVAADLFQALAEGGDPSPLPGLAIRRNGGVALTGPAAAVADLDTLPHPAWDLAPGFPRAYHPAAHTFQRLPSATMFTTRGCPEGCRFCDRSVFGNKVRGFSAGYVVGQMEKLVRDFGVRDLVIYDDIFPLMRTRLLEICELIRRRRIDLTWSCNSRVNLAERETLLAMRKAGCWQVGYGIESGVQEILDLIGKRTTPEQAERAVRLTEEAGIRAKGFFIIGHPGETRETVRRTMDFAKRIPLSDYQTCFFTPFPGTDLSAEIERYGRVVVGWERMNLLTPSFVPHGLSAEELGYWAARSYREFYLRPRIVWRYLKGLRSPAHLMRMVHGGVALASSLVRAGLRLAAARLRPGGTATFSGGR